VRSRPRTTLAALGAVLALGTGALALSGTASADTPDARTGAAVVQVQDTSPAPEDTSPAPGDSRGDRDCPEQSGAAPSTEAASTQL
jgi:hypothetical protein